MKNIGLIIYGKFKKNLFYAFISIFLTVLFKFCEK